MVEKDVVELDVHVGHTADTDTTAPRNNLKTNKKWLC